HGLMPVPAPATAEIVEAIPVKLGLVEYEATTPTGAAILAATVDCFSERMELSIAKTGYGIGQRDGEIPNVLRVYLAEADEGHGKDVLVEEALMLECNLDDMSPERYTHVMDLLFSSGAAEVFISPVVMKKSRPGHMLSVLCNRDTVERMKEILFTETSSIGLREQIVKKSMLRREILVVHTKYGDVELKRSYWNGQVVNEKPEFEQCRKLARDHGVTLEEISKEVTKKL
ncbi:MAG: LarC family nickel insertion protein, partial [Bacteroidota bacterium]|nr:LarC family nickel insertion protein [Bacteroidota bacterium]